jgi:hypothetical protein
MWVKVSLEKDGSLAAPGEATIEVSGGGCDPRALSLENNDLFFWVAPEKTVSILCKNSSPA